MLGTDGEGTLQPIRELLLMSAGSDGGCDSSADTGLPDFICLTAADWTAAAATAASTAPPLPSAAAAAARSARGSCFTLCCQTVLFFFLFRHSAYP